MGCLVGRLSTPATGTAGRPAARPPPLQVHRCSMFASRPAIAAGQSGPRVAAESAEPFGSSNSCRNTMKSTSCISEMSMNRHDFHTNNARNSSKKPFVDRKNRKWSGKYPKVIHLEPIIGRGDLPEQRKSATRVPLPHRRRRVRAHDRLPLLAHLRRRRQRNVVQIREDFQQHLHGECADRLFPCDIRLSGGRHLVGIVAQRIQQAAQRTWRIRLRSIFVDHIEQWADEWPSQRQIVQHLDVVVHVVVEGGGRIVVVADLRCRRIALRRIWRFVVARVLVVVGQIGERDLFDERKEEGMACAAHGLPEIRPVVSVAHATRTHQLWQWVELRLDQLFAFDFCIDCNQ